MESTLPGEFGKRFTARTITLGLSSSMSPSNLTDMNSWTRSA